VPRLANCKDDAELTRGILHNLAFSEDNVSAGRWWTQITYAFVHDSDTHLIANLMSLLPHAQSVHGRFGCWWVPIFFGGVFAGAHNTASKRYQAARRISEPLSLRRRVPPGLLEPAADAIDNLTRSFAGWLAPRVFRMITYVGASAGVWALQGASFCISLERVVLTVARRDWVEAESLPFAVLSHGVTLVSLSGQLSSTTAGFHAGDASGIDHSGHLDGFLFGVGAYATLRFAQLLRRRWRAPRYSTILDGVIFRRSSGYR
jgi:membrane associated rhomboid family serine protease